MLCLLHAETLFTQDVVVFQGLTHAWVSKSSDMHGSCEFCPEAHPLSRKSCLHCNRYASTCQTVGMNIGYFASFTVFLALNDADFSNAYLRSSPKPQGLLPLSTYLRAWGWVYAVVSLVVALAKREINYLPGPHTCSDPCFLHSML